MKRKCVVSCLRYLPVVAAGMAVVHIAHLMAGIYTPVFEIAEVVLGFTIITVFSRCLGFCWKHQLLIYYAGAVTACVYLQRYIGFGEARQELQVLLLAVGIVILAYVIIDWIWRKIRKN